LGSKRIGVATLTIQGDGDVTIRSPIGHFLYASADSFR